MSSGTTWQPEELLKHPKRNTLMGLKSAAPKIEPPAETDDKEKSVVFTVPGPPMGKPRMTRRDVWQKRECVVRYREYCDRLRAAAKKLPEDVYGITIQVYIAMPESWSKKKKAEYHGTMQRSKPDFDNVVKAVCDALFENDAVLGGGTCWKYWCHKNEERTVVRVLYD